MMTHPNRRLVIFVPEGDRTDKTVPVDLQDRWTLRLLRLLASAFGGATAYGRGVGAWKSGGRLHWDRVTVVESWISPATPRLESKLNRVWQVLEIMRLELRQEAVGCTLDGVWTRYENPRESQTRQP